MRTLTSANTCLRRYETAASDHKIQALANTKQRLQQQFPSLTDEQWALALAEYRPTLWVEGITEASVEENSLLGFANWLHLSWCTQEEDHVPIYGYEARYVARNLVYYSELAKDLLADDPTLLKPESVRQMQMLVRRLSVGNSIAERIHRAGQNLHD